MLKLKRLYLRNFMSLGEVDLDFSERGLIAITGFNNKGGDSNGSGKTAIIAGLVWTLFGRTPSGNRTKEVIQWGTGTLSGIVEFEQEDRIYRIVRTADTLDFLINGEHVKGLRKDIQEVINQALHTNYELFRTFNVFTKDWQWFITEVGDADKKKLFKSVLNLRKLDAALEQAKTILQTLKISANTLEGEIKQLEQSIPELERNYNKATQAEQEELQRRNASIAQLQKERQQRLATTSDVDYETLIAQLDEKINTYPTATINSQIEYHNAALSAIENNLFYNEQNSATLETQLEQFNTIGSDCPTCGQKLLPKARLTHRKHLEIMIKEYRDSTNELNNKKAECIDEIHRLNQSLQELTNLEQEKHNLKHAWKSQEDTKLQVEAFIALVDKAIAELQTPVTNIKQLAINAKELWEQAKSDFTTKSETFTSIIREIDIYTYVSWLYSRQGVITTIVQKCFDRLKFLANRYLIHICSEGFKIEISPFKILKSGDMQEEIDIYILDHGRRIPYASLSSGQQQRINTALLIALFTWGREIGANQFDLMLLDEVLDLSLGIKGQEDTISFIKSIRPLIYHIILISHKETMSDVFDRQIRIIRDTTGISSVA